ncbi:putative casein kinase-1 hhp1 [Armillaria nabsnona]|nr:putative casein kinase-1 hhp1 [Armillaria nabsnona]
MTLTYRRAPRGKPLLGQGACSNVFKSTELESGKTMALKMSRVSTRVKRPILQHETRILQLLKGHESIPVVYAYGQLVHFEYMAMEILGPSVAEQQKKNDPETGLMLKSVIPIMDQVLAGLEHTHSLGILYRDIKPENLLCALDNSTIKIIDFGISKPISHGPPNKYDPLKDRKTIVGSPTGQGFILIMGCSGKDLSSGFPVELGGLLDYSRFIDFGQLPDYRSFRRLFAALDEGISDGPRDWTSCDPQTTTCILDDPQLDIPGLDQDSDLDDDDYAFAAEDSYFEMDISIWERQRERDKDLTFLIEQEVYLDSCTPLIVQRFESANRKFPLMSCY